MQLQEMLRSFKVYFSSAVGSVSKHRNSKSPEAAAGCGAEACSIGTRAVALLTLLMTSFTDGLSRAEELEDHTGAAAACLQDACSLLLLPLSCAASLASALASSRHAQAHPADEVPDCGTYDKQGRASEITVARAAGEAACTLDTRGSGGQCGASEDAAAGVVEDAGAPLKAAAAAAADSSGAGDTCKCSYGRRPGSSSHRSSQGLGEAGLQSEQLQEFQTAWRSLLASVLSVAKQKPALKRDYSGDITGQICSLLKGLPSNEAANMCLQLASCAMAVLAQEVSTLTIDHPRWLLQPDTVCLADLVRICIRHLSRGSV
jgi:hypothetical protein